MSSLVLVADEGTLHIHALVGQNTGQIAASAVYQRKFIMPESTTVSSQVGTKLLFENDRVRVWDLRLAPGESTGLHRHTTDYLYVVLGGGTLQGVDADGNNKPVQEMTDGDVVFRNIDGKDIHEAINIGDRDWRNIVVELKE